MAALIATAQHQCKVNTVTYNDVELFRADALPVFASEQKSQHPVLV